MGVTFLLLSPLLSSLPYHPLPPSHLLILFYACLLPFLYMYIYILFICCCRVHAALTALFSFSLSIPLSSLSMDYLYRIIFEGLEGLVEGKERRKLEGWKRKLA